MVDLDNLMRQESTSLTSIEAKIDDIGLKQTSMHKNTVRTTFEIKKILTKEQIIKIKEIAAEKMKERRGDRGNDRGDRNERKGKGGKKGGGSPYND
jgi:Spy/CpxP family protein refolding chaperone